MFGRFFRKTPHTEQRAQALIAGFLKRHRELISVKAFARHIVANIDAGGVNAALKGFGPHAEAEVGDYPFYAVHLTIFAGGKCARLLPEPLDKDQGMVFTAMALCEAFGLEPQTAGKPVVDAILQTPRNEDDSDLTEEQVAALPEKERRLILLHEIAERDSDPVLEAFAGGARKMELSDYDADAAADLFELSVIPDPDHERLAANLKPVQD